MDPKGAQAVLDVFSQSSPDVAKAKIDLSKTYTNKFVEQATPRRIDDELRINPRSFNRSNHLIPTPSPLSERAL